MKSMLSSRERTSTKWLRTQGNEEKEGGVAKAADGKKEIAMKTDPDIKQENEQEVGDNADVTMYAYLDRGQSTLPCYAILTMVYTMYHANTNNLDQSLDNTYKSFNNSPLTIIVTFVTLAAAAS